MNTKNAREQALDLLVQIEKDQSYVGLILKEELKDTILQDKAFITEIVYGTIKYRLKLDYIINEFSNTPVRKMKPLIRNLLRMSVYQLFYLDKVPHSAAINEAVKLAKKRKFVNLSGFVNGLLRNIERNEKNITYPDKNKNPLGYLSIVYSIPEWMIKEWLLSYNVEEVEAICKALNERAKVCIRINTLCSSKEEVKKELENAGMITEEGELLDEALYIKNVDSLQRLESFKAGKWTVQDESAMLVAHVVNPLKGESILDMCSAPGGKSMHMAALLKNEGKIVSTDIHEHKIELIKQNAKRMGATCIEAIMQDGTVCNKKFIGAFDKVLLDAPCSGLGIIKRKPDIRYNKIEEDLEDIAAIQRALVGQAVKYLKENGVLVYSTCTISKKENEEMARYIMENFGLELVDISNTIPKKLQPYIKEKGMIQILPYMADTDGFFIASFRKRGDTDDRYSK